MNRKRAIIWAGLPIVVCLVGATPQLASAEGGYLYAIAANDGYGLQECLAGGTDCGQVVADAWCEAHGLGHALRFGAQSSFSGARPTHVASTDEPYVIRCGD